MAGNDVTIKEYIDARIEAQERAVKSALDALNRAATKDDAKVSLILSAIALFVSICSLVFLMVRK
jgi:hypothetical protein